MVARALTAWVLLGAAAAASETAPPAPSRGAKLALVGATLVDGRGKAPIADGVLLLERDRIAAAGERSSVALSSDAEVIDLSGRWIVPGLIDAHVHFFQSGRV